MPSADSTRFPRLMYVVAALMIVFGLAELITAFTHQFFGLTTAESSLSTEIGALLGACYFVGGLLLLTRRGWAATLTIALLCVDIVGRIAMVATGLYPLGTFRQAFGIVVGTLLAVIFALYIAVKRAVFR